jgi:hypothetical protein
LSQSSPRLRPGASLKSLDSRLRENDQLKDYYETVYKFILIGGRTFYEGRIENLLTGIKVLSILTITNLFQVRAIAKGAN